MKNFASVAEFWLTLFLKRPHPFLGFLGAVNRLTAFKPNEEMPAM